MRNRYLDHPDKHNFYYPCPVWRLAACGLRMIGIKTFLFHGKQPQNPLMAQIPMKN